ncbi:hypothetical protein H6F41_05045 [Pseudanabaena sp. FACHB-723]|uniref:Secreted protein n=1 Tax=Pseudanabaena mucicola FACHB-723 TaxID=2692860 RepID=A0ABR7ZU53_9CYAN|nr:hypothetical protein [Pseudanabaena mucicola FACHB-723]
MPLYLTVLTCSYAFAGANWISCDRSKASKRCSHFGMSGELSCHQVRATLLDGFSRTKNK